MVRQIAPVFFTLDIPRTVSYYQDKLGFTCEGAWPNSKVDPPVYAIVSRDHRAIHFRCAAPPSPNPDKYEEELLDAYIFVADADALHAEYAAKGVEFARGLGDMPWKCREFVIKDCDGRLLAFGADL
ncbi:bleomycin resistance protein [Acidobacteria bacterium AB60]|nr:bleomycin resistance protein [Acidobacteria bacterium AB60]